MASERDEQCSGSIFWQSPLAGQRRLPPNEVGYPYWNRSLAGPGPFIGIFMFAIAAMDVEKFFASRPVALATQGRLLLDECLFLVAILQNRKEVCGPVRRN